MPKVHVPHFLFNTAAIFGIGLVWYDFNKKVYERVFHLLKIMMCETAEEEKERRMKEREKETRRRKIEKEERRLQEEMKRLEEKKRIEEEAAGKTN